MRPEQRRRRPAGAPDQERRPAGVPEDPDGSDRDRAEKEDLPEREHGGRHPAAPGRGSEGPSTSDSSGPSGSEEAAGLVEHDLELLEETKRERDEYLELARRTKADFENYRKRVDREAARAEARGRARLARELLSVLDNLERALGAAEPADGDAAQSDIAEGVRLVYEELAAILANAGVEAYEPAGEEFDPELHEAMMTKPAPAEDAGKVLEVLAKGYRLNGELLRPARVVVGAAEET
jgi:molecular chaperone GrpE